MKKILVNHNFTPEKEWIGDDYLLYDRSDSKEYLKYFDQTKVIYTQNKGNVDYDKLSYLIEHYEKLPSVFLWGKSNLFKFITKEEFEEVKNNVEFTPLLTKNHKVYSDKLGAVCFYDVRGMYWERNDSWYATQMESRFKDYGEFARYLNLSNPQYLAFPPGGNYILTRERVHRYSRDFYEKMRDTLDYCQLPAEAHMCERTYFTLWR